MTLSVHHAPKAHAALLFFLLSALSEASGQVPQEASASALMVAFTSLVGRRALEGGKKSLNLFSSQPLAVLTGVSALWQGRPWVLGLVRPPEGLTAPLPCIYL